jgi:4-hydroxy-tetrahydrodipicolinate reductase
VPKVGVVGAVGKMGKTLIAMIQESPDLHLAAAVDQPGLQVIGKDAGSVAGLAETGVFIADDLAQVVTDIDVLIDFTIAVATEKNMEICHKAGTRMVIGTTGLSESQTARLDEISSSVPVVFASNYSIGVNATFQLVEMAASIFGDTVDVEIIESHHSHKVDAPSGTAISLGEHIAKGLGRDLTSVSQHGRHGLTGPRDRETIGFHAVRGGEIVGEHTVMFISGGERLEITHRAQSRTNFAEGALRAAGWVVSQAPGRYDMLDVLGLAKQR